MKFIYTRLIMLICVLAIFQYKVAAQDEISYDSYKPLLIKNAARLGVSSVDVADAVITNAYTDSSTQITFVYLQQAYQQIKVFNTIISVAFKNGSFLYTSGEFVKEIASKAGDATPKKSYLEATRAAANHLQLNANAVISPKANLFASKKKYTLAAAQIAKRDIETTLYWTPSDDKTQVTLTWNVNIDVLDSPDWWNIRINANTGEFVQQDNWTVDEKNTMPINETVPDRKNILLPDNPVNTVPPIKKKDYPAFIQPSPILNAPPSTTSATYNVIPYPIESLNFGSVATVSNPWLMAGAGNNAITNGWHYDGTNNYMITRGNNVFASLDVNNTNIPEPINNWPDTSTTANPSLTFTRAPIFTQQPFTSTSNVNKKFAIDNLFYWNNLMHDVFYQYGFNEAAGNFQNDNISRGGTGGDYVRADAQDGNGYSNANFSTPVDGTSGRMQMYLFVGTPIVTITSPAAIAGNVLAAEGGFTTTVSNKLKDTGPKAGKVVLQNDATGSHSGCSVATNAGAILGNIALIDAAGATGCTTYAYKVRNAQSAGAIACIIYSSNSSVFTPGGSDANSLGITIPVVVVTNATGIAIINQLTLGNAVNITLSTGIYIDGDLDNGVITHEYGHGISNRLTGGPANSSCLTNAEQGGEGWSDYFSLMMTTNWATAALTDGTKARPSGTYVFAQAANGAGIRRNPYSTNMAIDPITYANMAASTEVHNIGEIWCSALWDMTWNIIQQQGTITTNLYNSSGTGGNSIALNLVMMGLKLQPCGPGFLDARNAILSADSILYNYAHKCAIWNAFARRGMGMSAVQGLASSATDQTAAFDVPSGVKSAKPTPLLASVNSQSSITHTVSCDCAPVTGYQIKDTIPAGFTYISSTPTGTLNGNVLSFPATSFSALESKNFTIVLKAPSTGCIPDTVINDNRETKTVGGFVSAGTVGWGTSTAKAHSGTSSWFGPDVATTNSAMLTSANTAATALQPLSILSFYHYYSTETNYDGGVVEYSINNGVTWTDAGPLFFQNAYNAQMDASTVLTGRKAFTGTNTTFQQSLLNVSSFGTTPVSFRFRITSDVSGAADGWYVDDIMRVNGCGALLKTGYYNSATVRQDTTLQPIFVTPNVVLPLTLLWFYANQVGDQVQLSWKTVSEINVKDFGVEWSKDGVNWTTIGNLSAQNRNTNNYDYTHANPVSGNNFYRIKMNDADGRFTYSPIRTIKMQDKAKPLLVLIPNPVSSDAVLYVSKDLNASTVKIYNALGGLVRQTTIGTGAQQVQISTAGLAAGVYTIGTNGMGNEVIKMVVMH